MTPQPLGKLTTLILLVMFVGIITVSYAEIQPTNATNGCQIINETNTTITLISYPSSWRDCDYRYTAYKTTWDKKILNEHRLNPKGTFEGEWTHKEHDTDFSTLTGYEKHYHGLSVSEYLIKIETVRKL